MRAGAFLSTARCKHSSRDAGEPLCYPCSMSAEIATPVRLCKAITPGYLERRHLTMRMHLGRLTRLTTAFSQKLENFKAAVPLHFCYYNFVRLHKSLRMTPAMAGGVTQTISTIRDLVDAAR